MGDLSERMDAGVGPPGSVQLEAALTGRRFHRAFDLSLNRPRVLLNLPAAVTCSGVLDRQLQPHPGCLARTHTFEYLSELPELLAVGGPVAGALGLDRPVV